MSTNRIRARPCSSYNKIAYIMHASTTYSFHLQINISNRRYRMCSVTLYRYLSLMVRIFATFVLEVCYPAVRSIGRDTKFTVPFFLSSNGYGFVSRGFTDRREILQDGSATSQTGLFLFLRGIAPRMAKFWASTAAIWRICFLLKHLFYFVGDVRIWCIAILPSSI